MGGWLDNGYNMGIHRSEKDTLMKKEKEIKLVEVKGYFLYKCRNCGLTFQKEVISINNSKEGSLYWCFIDAKNSQYPSYRFETHDCNTEIIGLADLIGCKRITED